MKSQETVGLQELVEQQQRDLEKQRKFEMKQNRLKQKRKGR